MSRWQKWSLKIVIYHGGQWRGHTSVNINLSWHSQIFTIKNQYFLLHTLEKQKVNETYISLSAVILSHRFQQNYPKSTVELGPKYYLILFQKLLSLRASRTEIILTLIHGCSIYNRYTATNPLNCHYFQIFGKL